MAVDYQGPASVLRLSGADRRALAAYLPSTAAAGFARGDEVWASWRPDDAVIVKE